MAAMLATLPETERARLLDILPAEEREILAHMWRFWARPDQLAPDHDDWTIFLALAGRGWGKLLPNDTPIPTPTGWTTMGELRIGDHVFDEAGAACSVVAKFNEAEPELFRITFSDGSTIDACADHQWVTWRHCDRKAFLRSAYEADKSKFPADWPNWKPKRRDRAPKPGSKRSTYDQIGAAIRTTRQIKETLTYGGRDDLNHCIPVCGALQTADVELPIEPYTLGVWLGDGHSAGATITTMDEEILDLIRADGYPVRKLNSGKSGQAYAYAIGFMPPKRDRRNGRMTANGSLCSALKALGLLGNKHVPSTYLRSSSSQRLALLRGLMDTDGGVDYAQCVSFSTTTKSLADAVSELAISLGQRPRTEVRQTICGNNGRPGAKSWRVSWTPTINPFGITRKAYLVCRDTKQKFRNEHRMIVSVEPIRSRAGACITVDSPNSMYLAGKAMIPTHNTRAGAGWINEVAERGNHDTRIALIGPTNNDVRDVMILGDSGIVRSSPPWFKAEFFPSKRLVVWPNGSQAFAFSAEESERLRGPQFHAGWCDEIAAWNDLQDTWDMYQFGLRLGTSPKTFITTTPRPIKFVREMIANAAKPNSGIVVRRGSTYDNRANLASTFFSQIIKRYEGTRLGEQELNASILTESEAALWNREMLDAGRVSIENAPKFPDDYTRIGVALDPPVTAHETSDECGIIIGGLASDGNVYIMRDVSGRMKPHEWGQKAITAYHGYGADILVAEANNGGDMVEQVIRTLPGGETLAYKKVIATRGKYLRAEPVAALYQQGRVRHIGLHDQLETQMTTFEPQGGEKSPDRLDAMVWLVTELLLTGAAHAFW